jgi:lipopolysaccharide transport system permease protein
VIDGFRWVILRDVSLNLTSFLTSLVVICLVLATGVRYFRQTERTFADVI